jgi:hypothetical protein
MIAAVAKLSVVVLGVTAAILLLGAQSRLRESEHGPKWNGCSDGRG